MAFGINSANKAIKAVNDIELDPGTKVVVKGRLHIEAQKEVRFEDSAGGQYVGLRAPDPVGSSLTFILPSVDGSAGEFLSTDGGGNLTFAPGGFPFVASLDNSIIKADTVGSDEIQESGIIIDDSDQVTGVTRLNIESQGELRLEDAAGGEYASILAPTSISSSWALTLPNGPGSSGQSLTTDGTGEATWATQGKRDVETIRHSSAGSTLTDRTGEAEFNLSNVTETVDGSNVITVSDDAGNTRTKFDCDAANRCFCHISFSAAISAANSRATIYLNGSIFQEGQQQSLTAGFQTTANTNMRLTNSDFFSVGMATAQSIGNTGNPVFLSIICYGE